MRLHKISPILCPIKVMTHPRPLQTWTNCLTFIPNVDGISWVNTMEVDERELSLLSAAQPPMYCVFLTLAGGVPLSLNSVYCMGVNLPFDLI